MLTGMPLDFSFQQSLPRLQRMHTEARKSTNERSNGDELLSYTLQPTLSIRVTSQMLIDIKRVFIFILQDNYGS